MWLVVLRPDEQGVGQPAAFLLPPDSCVVISAGVWHAGPVPLEDAVVCEVLEAIGSADRFDRRSLPDLAQVLAVRVLLPEEQGRAQGALDLTRPSAVLLDAALHGRMRLGCLVIEDLNLKDEPPALAKEMGGAATGLRSMWQHVTDLAEIPGVAAGRELFEDLGIDGQRFPPRAEGLVDRALRGHSMPSDSPLASLLALCTLRMRVPMAAHDAASLGSQILVRTGAAGEAYPGTGRNRVVVEGRPVLCDQDGPFGSPIGDAGRTKPGPETERLLIVLYLPTSADPSGLEALLDGVARTLGEHCGGRETGRLIVG